MVGGLFMSLVASSLYSVTSTINNVVNIVNDVIGTVGDDVPIVDGVGRRSGSKAGGATEWSI
jgi:hypothetical protein